jgi:subtilisin-like proprotein convertase family protein
MLERRYWVFVVGLLTALSWSDALFAQCFLPVAQRIIAVDTHAVQLEWTHLNADSFEIEIRKTSNQDFSIQSYKAFSRNIQVQNLEPGTSYDYRIRAFCGNQVSNWTARGPFITVFDNKTFSCDRGIAIQDRNCGPGMSQSFPVLIDNYGNRRLGQDIELLEVRLVIKHTWPSDMHLQLRSPEGKLVTLSRYRGLGRDHFGNLNSGCQEPLVFTPFACESIIDSRDILTGNFLPEESFDQFNDGSLANGVWTLLICDQVETDIGVLEHIQLKFSDDACIPPTNYQLRSVGDSSITISFSTTSTCSDYIIEIVPEGYQPGIRDQKGHFDNLLMLANCSDGEATVQGLLPGLDYKVYLRSFCQDQTYSDNTCGLPIRTLCGNTTFLSGFDSQDNCTGFCADSCKLDDFWVNKVREGLKWTLYSGQTLTEDTGPDGDVFINGKYIYVEGSDPNCLSNGPAIMESPCIRWSTEDSSSCDISFFYHMFGASSGEIKLEYSQNEGNDWYSLWSVIDLNQREWQRVQLSIGALRGETLKLRFTGQPFGNFGDVALDEIALSGLLAIVPNDNIYYADVDGDGFGDPQNFIQSCLDMPPSGYVSNKLDCDDTNPLVNPGVEEIPCNGIDDNCSGKIDDSIGTLVIEGYAVQDESCRGAGNGEISVTISGGTFPIVAQWNDGAFGLQRSGLQSGHYSLTLSDVAGCEVILDSVFVFGRQLFEVDVIRIKANTCPGIHDGEIELNALNGQSPYIYIWEDGYSGAVRTQLPNGKYSITVTDNTGCQVVKDIDVFPGTIPLIQVLELREPSCPERGDGLIRVRSPLALPPVSFLWSNGQEGSILRDLQPGSYQLTITDAAGCTNTAAYTLVAPPDISVSLLAVDPVTCPGGRNGNIKVRANGGTGNLSYNWNNGFSFSKDIFNLSTGHYNLTVTDIRNCKAFLDSVFVAEPASFAINSLEITDNKCLLTNSGSIKPQIVGGTSPYRYFWSTGSQQPELTQLASGSYQLTISDLQNCKHTFPIFTVRSINTPLSIDLDDIRPVQCFGDLNGTISISVPNAVPPLEFHWSNSLRYFKNDYRDTLSQLRAGQYGVTITDADGCIGVLSSIALTGPSMPLNYAINIVNPILCYGDQNGAIQVSGSGGTAPYSYLWNTGTTGSQLNQISFGQYYCLISDTNNCKVETQMLELEQPDPLSISLFLLDERCQDGFASVRAVISGGTDPYRYKWSINGTEFYGQQINNLPCGLLNLQIEDDHICIADTTILLGISNTNDFYTDDILVFPNPFHNSICFSGKIPLGNCTLTPINGNHSIWIHKLEMETTDQICIEVSDIPAGVYLLHLPGNHIPKRVVKY